MAVIGVVPGRPALDRAGEIGVARGHLQMRFACLRMVGPGCGKAFLARAAGEECGVGFHTPPSFDSSGINKRPNDGHRMNFRCRIRGFTEDDVMPPGPVQRPVSKQQGWICDAKCEMSGRIHQIHRAMRFYGGPMEEALKILRGEADLCRRLAAAIHDREVIAQLLAAADDAESKIARLDPNTAPGLTVH